MLAALTLPSAALLMAACFSGVGSIAVAPFVVYGFGATDPIALEEFLAMELPSGRVLGRIPLGPITQGGAFAVSHDGRRAYVLDRGGSTWRLNELDTPSMHVLRRTPLPDAINALGVVSTIAVAGDGGRVYIQVSRIVGPPRWDDRLRAGQPDTEYAIAVYDVEQGAFTGEIALDPPWCGIGRLFALPDGRLAIYCGLGLSVRLIDPHAGRQVGTVDLGPPPRAGNLPGHPVSGVPGPDGRRFWVVHDNGDLLEIDFADLVVTRRAGLGGEHQQWIPHQRLHASADGTRLFLRASPGDLESRGRGLGTTLIIVDTATLQPVAAMRLPVPAFDLAPAPGGRTVVVTTFNTDGPGEWGTRLVEIPSGRALGLWPGALLGLEAR